MIKNEKINFSVFLLVFSLLLYSCAGSKQVVNIKDPGEDGESPLLVDKSKNAELTIGTMYHDAVKAKLIGNKEQAITLFKEVLKTDPDNHAAMYELAKLLIENDNLLEAAPYARQAIKLDPSNIWYQRINADLFAYEGKFNEAAKIYKKLLQEYPDEPEFIFDLAYVYERGKNYKEAIKAYDDLEELIGIDDNVSLQKEKLYLRINDLEGAARELNKLIETFPDNSRFYGMLAELYEKNNMPEKALQIYNDLLETDPDNPYAAFALANYYHEKGNKEKFEEYIHQAYQNPELNIDVKIGFLLNFVDNVKNSPDKRAEAFKLANLVVQTHPSDAKGYALYGDLLYHSDSSSAALEQYNKALDINNSIFSVWQQVMLITADMQQFDSLMVVSQEAMELFPNQPMPYYFNGIAKNQLKKHESAVRVLDQALLIGSANRALMAEIYASLAEAHHALKDYKLSDSNYDKSLEINPNNAYVLNNYSYYLSTRNQNLPKAEEMAMQANKLSPGNSAFEDTYGWVLYKLGKYTEAKEWIEKSLKSGGESRPVILDHYGDVLFKLGDVDQAVKYWQKALEKGGEDERISKKVRERQIYE